MPTFKTSYDTPANYAYDPEKIEVVDGLAKLKGSSLWDGLKVYLRMEEASWDGTLDEILDHSGNGNHGKANGNTTTADIGKLGRCGDFDGTGAVDLPDMAFLNNTQQFSLAFWIDTNVSDRNMAFSKVIDNNNRISININHPDGTYFVIRNGNSCYGMGDLPTSGWHFFVFVFDGTKATDSERMKIYLDGVELVLTFNDPVPDATPTTPAAQLGGYQSGDFMIALMDEFAGWDRPLGVTEVTELFNAGNGRIMQQYVNDEPSIEKISGDTDSIYSLQSFIESLGAGNEGLVAYQLSKNGTDWEYWDGNEWLAAGTNHNTADEVNTNLSTFNATLNKVFIKAFLVSDGTQAVELDEIQIEYVQKLSYASDEIISGDGSTTEFELRQNFRNGTCRITYNDRIFYEYREISPNKIKFDLAPSASDVIKISYYAETEAGRLNAVRYATPAQVKAISRAANISSADEGELEKLIREAEQSINGHCGFWEKNDSSQKLLFPRAEDSELDEEYSAIPQEITDATILIVEQLFLQGAPTLEGTVSEEKIGDYSYKKTAVKTELIPERVKLTLRGFRKLTGKVNLKTE